jgi:hypothetical protein
MPTAAMIVGDVLSYVLLRDMPRSAAFLVMLAHRAL